jgi:hypothetical protein
VKTVVKGLFLAALKLITEVWQENVGKTEPK